jgi:hypothetical protein
VPPPYVYVCCHARVQWRDIVKVLRRPEGGRGPHGPMATPTKAMGGPRPSRSRVQYMAAEVVAPAPIAKKGACTHVCRGMGAVTLQSCPKQRPSHLYT